MGPSFFEGKDFTRAHRAWNPLFCYRNGRRTVGFLEEIDCRTLTRVQGTFCFAIEIAVEPLVSFKKFVAEH